MAVQNMAHTKLNQKHSQTAYHIRNEKKKNKFAGKKLHIPSGEVYAKCDKTDETDCVVFFFLLLQNQNGK